MRRLFSIYLAKWQMCDTSKFQTFCEICSHCFTSGFVSTPPPQLSALQDIFRLHVPSSAKVRLCACEGLHMCVRSGMWFCSLPANCGFSLRYFPTLLSLLLWRKKKKPNVSCFLDYSERTCFVCLLCVVAGVCFVLWGNFGVLIKKAVSLCKLQKHKHMP